MVGATFALTCTLVLMVPAPDPPVPVMLPDSTSILELPVATTAPDAPPIDVTVYTGSSAWLVLVSLLISLVAVSISVAQLRSNARESRRNLPTIRALVRYWDPDADTKVRGDRGIYINVTNLGKTATQIDPGWLATAKGARAADGSQAAIAIPAHLKGDNNSPIPVRLEGYSTASWAVDPGDVQLGEAVAVTIYTGHGEVIVAFAKMNDVEGNSGSELRLSGKAADHGIDVFELAPPVQLSAVKRLRQAVSSWWPS